MLFGVMHPSTLCDNDDGDCNKQNCKRNHQVKSKQSIVFHTVESDELYTLLLDLPGVKATDISVDLVKTNILKVHAVRKLKNEEQITLEQNFYVDKKVANTAGAKALLENGVLTIQMAKAQPSETLIVDIKTGDIGSEENSNITDQFKWTLDLPGVNIGDFQVKYHDDHVSVMATRKRGDNVVKIFKKVSMSEEKYNVQKLQAFLEDGVLTVMAPAYQEDKLDVADAKEKVTNIPVLVPPVEDKGVSTSMDGVSVVVNPFDDSVVLNH
jgi:HSP20 family molecular chaperone IbpA